MAKTPQRKLQAAARWRRLKQERDPEWAAKFREYQSAYRQNNRERIKAQQKEHYRQNARMVVLRKHGITVAEYERLERAQRGVCAICHGEPNGRWKTLCVDHDHETGQVRGLLCETCNRGLGYLKDSLEVVQRAMRYLKQYRKQFENECAREKE